MGAGAGEGTGVGVSGAQRVDGGRQGRGRMGASVSQGQSPSEKMGSSGDG